MSYLMKRIFITAKDISQYVCNEVLGYLKCLEKDYVFWVKVKDIIDESSHKKLYKY